jgi:hypothetical protein
MYTKVIRNQFEIKEGTIIHTPHGAEFTPVTGTADSILIWTGEIGAVTDRGAIPLCRCFRSDEDDLAASFAGSLSCCGSKYAIKLALLMRR